MTQHPDGPKPDIGHAVAIPTRPGLFRSDVHGGSVYLAQPLTRLIGPYHNVPVAGYSSSQALPDAQQTLGQRTAAAQMGSFAVWQIPITNYDGTPLATPPALNVQPYPNNLGQIVPFHPLGLTSDLGHGGA